MLTASALAAQQPPPSTTTTTGASTPATAYSHDRDAPAATATRITGTIHIDGVLDEPQWKTAQPVTQLTQLDPREGKPASERTDIRFLYDDDALYVGATMYDAHPVTGRLGRRDMDMSASDWLTVILDANHNHLTAVGFEVNPLGVRRDQTRSPNGEDDSWDPVWEVTSARSDSGWTAEMRIPFSQLRFSGKTNLVWGLQIERQIARNQEFANWAFTPRDQPGGLPRFGHLMGLSGLASGKRLELMPYAVARSENIYRAGNSFRDDHEFHGDAGVDLKYRLSTNLTLDATVNPDFGQVEVDPAVINLSAFETFFPEKRPFFVEGSELFNFGTDGTNSVFYSRRIGHAPTLSPSYNDVDVAEVTRILGATKLTGRTAGGWATGMLDAVTERETARYRTPEGVEGTQMAEPLTNFFAGRLRKEARQGQTNVGAFLGAVNRGRMETPLASILRKNAYSGGLDFTHQWGQRTWTARGFLAGSRVSGSTTAITRTQQASYHLFQRPDATHLELDPNATSLTGFAGSAFLAKRIGRSWNFNGGFNTISPKYEINDLGFQRRADRFDMELDAGYQRTIPGRFRRWSVSGTSLVEHNYAWDEISNRLFLNGFVQFQNYWTARLNETISFGGTVDDRLTRGGPAADRPAFIQSNASVFSDPRRAVVYGVGAFVQTGIAAQSRQISGDVTIKPRPNFDIEFSPGFALDKSAAQYLRRAADSTAASTYGARYVFASVRQHTVSMDTRVNYTFSPGLSLQVFAQPFIATGAFGPPKEFARPRSFEFLTYGKDIGVIQNGRIYPNGTGTGAVSFAVPKPDFNFGSLRGNAVVRWEWRPGSTMYFAWQQTRSDFAPIGDFSFGRDFRNVFATRPDNVFLIKASYWLNP